jgi:hypothetical protein
MKIYFTAVSLLLLIFASCRERNNMFDPVSSDFTPPPAIFSAVADSAIYNEQWILIGVHFTINFVENFEKETILHNVLYEFNDSVKTEKTSFDVRMNYGDRIYDRDVYATYDFGLFCLTIYFGGIPIGAATFAIVDDGGAMVIKPVEDN